MIRTEQDLLLSRIISGITIFSLNGKKYVLRPPDAIIIQMADTIYQETIKDNLYNDWILLKDTEVILIENGLWHISNDDIIKNLDKKLENLKVELFQNFIQVSKRKELKKQINNANKSRIKLITTKHSMDDHTLEAYAGRIRNEYIIMNSLYTINNRKVFRNKKIASESASFLNEVAAELVTLIPSVDTLKKLARSESWKSYWTSGNKSNIFPGTSSSWTDEQRALVNITRMYDSVMEHPECPSQDIIDDDDALEGWMIFQKRKNEAEKNKSKADAMISKNMSKASEVYMVASSKEEYDQIYSANSMESKNRMKEKFAIISANEKVHEHELPDVRAEALQKLEQSRPKR